MLLRFRADVINLKPVGVVILAGNTLQNTGLYTEMILNNMYSMVELAEANNIKVILCSVPAKYFTGSPKRNLQQQFALNESIQRYAKEKDFVVYRLLFFTSRQSERIALTYSNDWRPSQCCRI
jgi:hypothetical protein